MGHSTKLGILLLVSAAAAGCSDGDDTTVGTDGTVAPIVVCGPSDETARDDAVFRALITRRWQAGYCDPGGMPTWGCHRLQLAGDGTFVWELPPDAGGGVRSGGWNFRARSDEGGILCFDDGSVLGFETNEPQPGTDQPVLELGTQAFAGMEEVGATGDRAALPEVRTDGVFDALCRTSWRKTNVFDVDYMPDELALTDDGTFEASYREGACSHTGRWGLLEGRLVSMSDTNECDVRASYPQPARLTSMDERPVVADGMLRFLSGTTYRSTGEPAGSTQVFGFASYGGDERLEIAGSFDGSFAAGEPRELRFRYENQGASEQWMGRLRIRLQKLSEQGYPDGMPETLVEHDYQQSALAPGAAMEDTAEIVIPNAGRYLLDIDVSSSTLRHAFPNGRTYRVTIP